MPISFVCLSCAAKLCAPDKGAGRRNRCPKCGTAVVIPSRTQQSPEVVRAEPQPVEYPDTDWMTKARRPQTRLLLASLLDAEAKAWAEGTLAEMQLPKGASK